MAEAAGSSSERSINHSNYGVFITEISEQCRFVLMAVRDLEQVEGLDRSLYRLMGRRLEEQKKRFGFPPTKSSEAAEFELISRYIELQSLGLWERLRQIRFYVDNIVDHAARIERLLWPTVTSSVDASSAPERGTEVRRRLGISDSSTFPRSIRGLRNGWQHLDERIEKHLDKRRSATNAEDDEVETSPTSLRVSRDPGLTVEAQGVRLELDPIIDEVRILLARCQLAGRTVDDPEMATFYKMQLEF